MPRQVLTFLFIFLLVMFIMRTCAPKENLPAAVVTESAPDSEEGTYVLNNGVVLALDGSVVSITQDGVAVVRPVASWRRTLQMALRYKNGAKRPIPASVWKSSEVDGGREFVYEEDDLKITKRFVAGDNTLTMHVTIVGAGDPLVGLEIDAASGVVLPRTDDAEEPGVFTRLSGSKLHFETIADLVTRREQKRTVQLKLLHDGKEPAPDYSERKLLDPRQSIERFGVLGKSHYLLLENLDAAHAVNTDVYRLTRDGDEEDQIETWISLDFDGGRYEGSFHLRWGTRAEIGAIEQALPAKTMTAKAKRYRLENDTMRVLLSDRGASIEALWLKQYSLEAGQEPGEQSWIPMIRDVVPVRHRSLSLYADPQSYGASLSLDVWDTTVATNRQSIKFTLTTATGWEFIKIIRLPEEGKYDLGVTIKVRPPAGGDNRPVVYSLVGPAGSYIEDSYRGIIGAEPPSGFFLERGGGEDDDDYIETIAKEEEAFAHTYGKDFARGYLRAAGVRGAFFVCALVTEERTDSKGRPAGYVKEARVKLIELTRAIERPNGESSRQSLKGLITLAVPFSDGEAVSEFWLYAGPNQRSDLKELLIEDAVDFGFFGGIGRLLMWLMKALHGLLGSYGLAIIFMTLIVRVILMPVSYRTQLGMMRYSKRIQKIKPQLEELEKRYGSNRRKMNEERMKVMRENKVGFPLGCLMIFFQIPIWFALFGALRVEFALRHESFLWATDLTMPDRLINLPFWPGAFNLLPILMLVLWVIQQRLAPSPGGDDPNVKMQMKMVRYMPYIFFFFLYKYAAALSVYMCVSSAWGIVEAKFVRKAVKSAEAADAS